MKKVAVVGGGVVGATTAYYLSRNKDVDVDLYDWGKYQASGAAVGIICPWLNQRRNKFWYELVRDGAEFYDKLIDDLNTSSFYQKVGAVYINEKMEDKMYKIAQKRHKESYKLEEVRRIKKNNTDILMPDDFNWESGIFVKGAARVDGKVLIQELIKSGIENGLNVINKKVEVSGLEEKYLIEGKEYDYLVLASGAFLKETLDFKPEYKVDVFKQKGQLIEFDLNNEEKYPVLMPKGEIDFLFDDQGNLVIGASHENGFKDFDVDTLVLENLHKEASKHYPFLLDKDYHSFRIGVRAHSSDYTPFYGNLEKDKNLYLASGLGSSGLSSGPIIAYRIAMDIIGDTKLYEEYFNANDYVQRVK